MSARKMREEAQITTLRQRREEQCLKFARKCASDEQFSHLFPKKWLGGALGGDRGRRVPGNQGTM